MKSNHKQNEREDDDMFHALSLKPEFMIDDYRELLKKAIKEETNQEPEQITALT